MHHMNEEKYKEMYEDYCEILAKDVWKSKDLEYMHYMVTILDYGYKVDKANDKTPLNNTNTYK